MNGEYQPIYQLRRGEIVESVRTPLANPDFGPFIQKVKDKAPDALFVFVPSGQGLAVMKQFEERGLKQAGIRLTSLQLLGAPGGTLQDELDTLAILVFSSRTASSAWCSSSRSAASVRTRRRPSRAGRRQLTCPGS